MLLNATIITLSNVDICKNTPQKYAAYSICYNVQQFKFFLVVAAVPLILGLAYVNIEMEQKCKNLHITIYLNCLGYYFNRWYVLRI